MVKQLYILLIFNSPIPHQHTCWLLHMFLWFVHAISPKCSTFYSPTLNTISYYLWYQTFYCCVTNLQDGIIFCCFIFPCPQVVLLNLIWLNFALFAAAPSQTLMLAWFFQRCFIKGMMLTQISGPLFVVQSVHMLQTITCWIAMFPRSTCYKTRTIWLRY